jgi:phosphate-selective porin OprO/OprP
MVILVGILPGWTYAQDTAGIKPNGTDGLVFPPRIADTTFATKKMDLEPNEFEGTYSTFRIGMGFIGDFTAYSQSAVFKQQMDSLKLDLEPTYQTRDFRILGSGKFKRTKRFIAWKFSYLYDGDKKVWMVRESGLTIGVPELKGHFFIGRTKEGYSMIKVMNGHSALANERQMALDPVPILADGIKYFGYFPKTRLFANLGYFNDLISKGQSFSTLAWQYVGRIGWVPFYNAKKSTLLHIAANLQYAKPLNGKFTVKSRPESNPTPQLINTGEFPASKTSSIGAEIYYNRNRFSIGSEIMEHHFYHDSAANHRFYGGNIVASIFLTNTSRPYNTTGNVYGFVPVKKSVFKGGMGEIELVLHASTFNLNNGSIKGGQFTRFTSMINWYLAKFLRWELIYGYGQLDRFNLKGNVHFFETRIQITAM